MKDTVSETPLGKTHISEAPAKGQSGIAALNYQDA